MRFNGGFGLKQFNQHLGMVLQTGLHWLVQ